MVRNTNKKTFQILTYIILATVLIGAVGFFAFVTNGFKSKASSFYVEVDNKVYKSDNVSALTLPSDTGIRFNCKYLLGAEQKDTFSVKVLPNSKQVTDFDFYVNDIVYSFCAESEYTKGFNISMQNDGFILEIPSNNSILSILQKNYDGQTITTDEYVDTLNNSFFVLSISSSDVKTTINIPIKFASRIGVISVELDKGELLL